MLGDQGLRDTLSQVDTIYGDGTFDRCPLQDKKGYLLDSFAELYTLIVERESNGTRAYIPIMHALLPSQEQATYLRVFNIVREVYPQLRPRYFKSDYQPGPMNAIRSIYRDIQTEGDSFHFVKAATKLLQNKALRKLYNRDLEIYEQVRLMVSPMFVPVERVSAYWHVIIRPLITRPELIQMRDDIQRIWIGTPPNQITGERGRSPHFGHALWNQHKVTLEERQRHNNPSESNNSKLRKLVKENPTVWNFLLGTRSAYSGDFRRIYNVSYKSYRNSCRETFIGRF